MSQGTQASKAYTAASIDDIPTVSDEEAPQTEWKPVRRGTKAGSTARGLEPPAACAAGYSRSRNAGF